MNASPIQIKKSNQIINTLEIDEENNKIIAIKKSPKL